MLTHTQKKIIIIVSHSEIVLWGNPLARFFRFAKSGGRSGFASTGCSIINWVGWFLCRKMEVIVVSLDEAETLWSTVKSGEK